MPKAEELIKTHSHRIPRENEPELRQQWRERIDAEIKRSAEALEKAKAALIGPWPKPR